LRIYNLGKLRIYNLDRLQIYSLGRLRIYSLGGGKVLVYILVYRGITVHILGYRGIIVYSVVRNLRVGYILASKVTSKAALVYRANLVKWVRYKASDCIKFGRSKEFFYSFNLV
jgi:hypothetical protein